MEQHDWDTAGWPHEGDPLEPGPPAAPPSGDDVGDDAGAFPPEYGDLDAIAPTPVDDADWEAPVHYADLGFADDAVTDRPDDHPADASALADTGPAGGLGVPVGADPDLLRHADDGGWAEQAYPPELLGFDRLEPVDGYPWADPALLGVPDDLQAADPIAPDAALRDPTPADLAAYDGTQLPTGTQHAGTEAWAALRGSPDPATSALARWWAPG